MGSSGSSHAAPRPVSEMDLRDQICGVIYGQAIGDAIGLLTEFMTKKEAKVYYGKKVSNGLKYDDKVPDFHRSRWENGDWTDDTDQMLAIMQSLLDNDGKIVPADVGQKFVQWMKHGIAEHGDAGGMGIGRTTITVLRHPKYETQPHECAFEVWDSSGRNIAPNGAVMRTSILGVHDFNSLDKVIDNTVNVSKCTHVDPRCIASCVAVTVAISVMLTRDDRFINSNKYFKVDAIIEFAFEKGVQYLEDQSHKDEFKAALFAKDLKSLKLCEAGKIGYTYKTLGVGFWAFKQNDFREALSKVVMEGGDADTNGSVAGALLGCKIGKSNLPSDWVNELKHKAWLDNKIQSYLNLLVRMETIPAED